MSMIKAMAAYGSWRSPISAESLVQGAAGISEVIPDGDAVWWCESRPSQRDARALLIQKSEGNHFLRFQKCVPLI